MRPDQLRCFFFAHWTCRKVGKKVANKMYAVPIEMRWWSGLTLILMLFARTHSHANRFAQIYFGRAHTRTHKLNHSPSNGGKKSHRKWFIICIITTQMCRFSFSETDRNWQDHMCLLHIGHMYTCVSDCVLVIRPFDNRVQKHTCFW